MPYSYVEVTASAGQHLINLSYAYLDKLHVHVTVNGVELNQAQLVWNTPTQIDIATANGGNLTLGQKVKAYRETPAGTPLVTFQPGAFNHADLNDEVVQLLYIVQEAYDIALISQGILPQVITDADTVAASLIDITAKYASISGWYTSINIWQAAVAAATTAATNAASTASAGATTVTNLAAQVVDNATAAVDAKNTAGLSATSATASAAAALASKNAAAISETNAANSATAAAAAAGVYTPTADQIVAAGAITTIATGDLFTISRPGSPNILKKITDANLITWITGNITGKQNSSAELTAIAAITPTNDDIIQRKAGAWVNRTMAQLWADLQATAKTYFDTLYVPISTFASNVRIVALTGFSAATVTAVVAADTILDAIGKLQGQINTINTSLATFITASSTTTFTNKRTTKRVFSEASNATPTPNADSYDAHHVTALAAAAAFANPTGTATEEQQLMIRVKDNGTARALTWGTEYRAMGTALPTTTVASKTMYIGLIRNVTDTKWDCVAVAQEA